MSTSSTICTIVGYIVWLDISYCTVSSKVSSICSWGLLEVHRGGALNSIKSVDKIPDTYFWVIPRVMLEHAKMSPWSIEHTSPPGSKYGKKKHKQVTINLLYAYFTETWSYGSTPYEDSILWSTMRCAMWVRIDKRNQSIHTPSTYVHAPIFNIAYHKLGGYVVDIP